VHLFYPFESESGGERPFSDKQDNDCPLLGECGKLIITYDGGELFPRHLPDDAHQLINYKLTFYTKIRKKRLYILVS
jgi:hypothetical protein